MNTHIKISTTHRLLSLFTSAALISAAFVMTLTTAHADPTGKGGRTSRFGDGCGDCHGVSVSTSTQVTLQGAGGALTVEPGSVTEFTIVVAHPSMAKAGIDIAVQDAEDDGNSVGTLSAGQGMKYNSIYDELTHNTPMTMVDGKAAFTFTWKAPDVPGTYYLQAIGNAVNGNDRDDAADEWAWMSPVAITVSSTSGIADADHSAATFSIAPLPLMAGNLATLDGLPADAERVTFTDLSGQEVYLTAISTSEGGVPLAIPQLAPGGYVVAIHTSSGQRRARFVVIQ